jgi:hypothetical protein
MKCHICENETEFSCDSCEEPVCEDCCVQMTIHNQIDYPLCQECYGFREDAARYEAQREEEREERKQKERDKKNAKKRANYWKPENVEKRRKRKEEKMKKDLEHVIRSMANALSIFSDSFEQMGVSIRPPDIPDSEGKDS